MEKKRKARSNNKSNINSHNHGNLTILLVLFIIGLALFITSIFVKHELTKMILNLLAIAFSGGHVIYEGFESTIKNSLSKRRFIPNIHLLMTVAAIGAIIIKEYHEAALLILIFAGAHFLEDYAQSKSNKEITNLINLNPPYARLINDDGRLEIVDIKELKIGDKLRVLNGDQVPIDGIIIAGTPSVNQANITGESIPVDKKIGDIVYGSTINGDGIFTMEVTKDSSETVLAKIVKLVSQTQENTSKRANFIKRLEPIYTTAIFILAPLFYLLGFYLLGWDSDISLYRSMVFLIGASPCALAATDIPATLSAISNLAKRGVLFKGGAYLSLLSEVKVVAFDKTGTLTGGKAVVTDIILAKELKEAEKELYFNILTSMERKSNHPIAQAITNHFSAATEIEIDVKNIIGVGVEARYNNKKYFVGKPANYLSVMPELEKEKSLLEEDGKTIIYFGVDDEVICLLAIQDIPKESAKDTLLYLKNNNIKTVMITGDTINTANSVSRNLKIDETYGNVLPDEKSSIIDELKNKYGITAMLGDGVNDAPALVSADIGIAMGDGTDIAIDASDAVLIKNDLSKFVYTHKVSKKLNKVVWQNIIFATIIILFLTIMNILGLMQMGFAVLIHEGSTLLVVLNGLRLLKKVN
ncbi:MAG: cadmium-translocating P-type ATPase [Acholeplasmataceae bacterium]|jgi:Cd2+/Zn2+-exporting ATPase|nr:cadmium-translocating P-type ATPase [Acholeplasmataceae bacterium]